jgi:hypothetical protein
VRQAILSYRRTVLGWLLLLLGSFIAAVATMVGIWS